MGDIFDATERPPPAPKSETANRTTERACNLPQRPSSRPVSALSIRRCLISYRTAEKGRKLDPEETRRRNVCPLGQAWERAVELELLQLHAPHQNVAALPHQNELTGVERRPRDGDVDIYTLLWTVIPAETAGPHAAST